MGFKAKGYAGTRHPCGARRRGWGAERQVGYAIVLAEPDSKAAAINAPAEAALPVGGLIASLAVG